MKKLGYCRKVVLRKGERHGHEMVGIDQVVRICSHIKNGEHSCLEPYLYLTGPWPRKAAKIADFAGGCRINPV